MKLDPGSAFPDLDLPDHTGRDRQLSEIAAGEPVVLLFSRGWWCPKEQRHLRETTALQDEFEVAYSRIVVVSIDAPEVQSAFRADLGARFTFLSDGDRHWLEQLDLLDAPANHNGDSLKELGDFPSLADPRHANAYSPLWDAQGGAWTPKAISEGLDTRQEDENEILNLARQRPDLLTGPKGAPYGSAGFVIDCPTIAFTAEEPVIDQVAPVAGAQG